MKKKEKEKVKYNLWQNSVYIIKEAWKYKKSYVIHMVLEVIIALALALLTLFLPQVVTKQILSGFSVGTLIVTILLFTIGLAIVNASKNALESLAQSRRVNLRINTLSTVQKKVLITDYANLEDKKFIDGRQKANDMSSNNSSPTEQIYYKFITFTTSILGFIIYIILLVSVNPIVLLITALTTVVGAFLRNWVNKWYYNHEEEPISYNKRLWYIARLGENHSYAKETRIFSMVTWLNDVYETNKRLLQNFNKRVQIRYLIVDIIDCVAVFIREGIAYIYLIILVLNNEIRVDSFILLLAAISGFSTWIMTIFLDYSILAKYSLDYNRLREWLEFPNKFKRENGESIKPKKDGKYSLELRNVSFCYSGADKNTLENINLLINPNENIAVVGLNGAGKTTLVKLMCGMYDPTAGEILLNGKNIKDYNRTEYYTMFTAVFQKFSILPVTIAENISETTKDLIDYKKVDKVLKLADIKDKIDTLTEGVNSLMLKNIHDEAVEFSGGETQKLMLARALYKNSPILILDEPTAALDPIAENALYEKYNELSENKTSIYISHRLASTRFCDRIILLDEKHIIEMGTHNELIAKGCKYYELFEIQSKYYKENVEVNSYE